MPKQKMAAIVPIPEEFTHLHLSLDGSYQVLTKWRGFNDPTWCDVNGLCRTHPHVERHLDMLIVGCNRDMCVKTASLYMTLSTSIALTKLLRQQPELRKSVNAVVNAQHLGDKVKTRLLNQIVETKTSVDVWTLTNVSTAASRANDLAAAAILSSLSSRV